MATVISLIVCPEAGRSFTLWDTRQSDAALRNAGASALIDTENSLLVVARPDQPSSPVDPGDCVVFSSGTTGMPKGIIGSGRGLAQFITWQAGTFNTCPGDR